ncbi:general secretion pathway protein GspK [Candidatus Sumerlaeota bacterium]|nr:general secretion pathway protein GspK [Candidatus Sumerlaeota bacterium]
MKFQVTRHTASSGSTFIIVVGILSVLVLIATALSFSTRMDVISSSNFADGVQMRISAVTGISASLELLNKEPRYTSFMQDWAITDKPVFSPVPLKKDSSMRLLARSRVRRAQKSTQINNERLVNLMISDECAKININTASEQGLSRALREILKDSGSGLSEVADTLARLIVQHRYGKDQRPGIAGYDDDADRSDVQVLRDRVDQDHDGIVDNPEEVIDSVLYNGIDEDLNGVLDNPEEGAEHDGIDNDRDGVVDEHDEGIDDEKEFIADFRLPAFGDDQRWEQVSELLQLPGIDEKIFRAIAPYVTTFSASEEIYYLGTKIYPKLNINYASVQEIYDVLSEYFPDKNELLLQQFAVNIADFRDPDDVPTVFPGSDTAMPVIGVEITPYITEIYADSLTDTVDGDDGQFVELYNPYPMAIDIDGWELVVGGSSVRLTGKIAPEGFVIITDDYNEANDPSPEDETEHYGSFYDIFDQVPNKRTKRLIEEPDFNIPDNEGIVYLRDEEGNLIDYQAYKNGRYTGVSRTFQRNDPRVRYVEKLPPTPFQFDDNKKHQETLRITLKDVVAIQDRPFHSPGELMYVSSGFFDPATNSSQVWQEPSLKINIDSDKIDSRIIDLFTIAPTMRRHLSDVVIQKLNPDNDSTSAKRLKEKIELLERPIVIGRININTASYYTLLSLPGMSEDMAERIVKRRYLLADSISRGTEKQNVVSPSELTPFKTISDLLRRDDLWAEGITEQERLYLFKEWANFITTNSRSFSVVAQSAPIKPAKIVRRSHPISIFTMLCLDQTNSPVLYFRYLNQ